MDLLIRLDAAEPMRYDPSGAAPLRMAKRIRRAALRVGGEDAVAAEATRHFGLPATQLTYLQQISWPLFPPSQPNAA
jgi:hypothetical protein